MLKEAASMILGLKKPWRKDGYVIRSNMRGRYPVPVMQRVSTEWAMGYFFCVRRSLMERWNIWFDEGMDRYAYAEDLDFSIRYCLMAQQERLNCVLEPKIYVDHLASNEWRTPSEEAVRYFVRNRRRIAHKVYPNRWWYPITMNCFDTLFAIIKMPSDFEYSSYLLKSIYSKSGRISDKAN